MCLCLWLCVCSWVCVCVNDKSFDRWLLPCYVLLFDVTQSAEAVHELLIIMTVTSSDQDRNSCVRLVLYFVIG